MRLVEIPGLSDWMRERHAEVLWVIPAPEGREILAIDVRGTKFLIQVHGLEWEPFCPVTDEQDPLVSMDQCLSAMS